MTRRAALLAAFGATLVSAGCARVAHVSGRVVMDGQPYQPTEEMLALTFTRADGGVSMSSSVQKDGTFTVYGPEGEGLPPGKYKVGYYSDIEGGKGRKRIKDLPADKSPAEFDLAAGDKLDLVIDVLKATVTKK